MWVIAVGVRSLEANYVSRCLYVGVRDTTMRRLTSTLIIAIAVISSLFALDAKVGASYVDNKFFMQVSQYNGSRLYSGGAYITTDESGDIVYRRYVKKGCEFKEEELGKLYVDPSFGIMDEGNIGLFHYDYKFNASASIKMNEVTNFRGSANVGIGNGKIGAFLSAGKEYYSVFGGSITEDVTEVGVTVRLHEDLSKFFSMEAELGASLYPTFELCNVETSISRENTFSTKLYARATVDIGFLKAYVGGGITSWQIPSIRDMGLVGGFIPIQIRNLFDVGVEIDLGNVGFFIDYNYFCDHPEICWERITTWNIYTNSVYGLATCGIIIEV